LNVRPRAPQWSSDSRFTREHHVKQIAIVENWQTWRAIDFGYRHPACLWAQRSPAGQLFIVDELLPENATTPEFVAQIKEREESFALAEPVVASFCDPAGKAANVQTAESEFANFSREGLQPHGQSSSVPDGCMRIMNSLADEEQPMVVAERCVGLIRALSQVKPHRSQHEIYNNDHELFSHPLERRDAGVRAVPGLAVPDRLQRGRDDVLGRRQVEVAEMEGVDLVALGREDGRLGRHGKGGLGAQTGDALGDPGPGYGMHRFLLAPCTPT
jgi:hypothetical protein